MEDDPIPWYIKAHLKACMNEAEYKEWEQRWLQSYAEATKQLMKQRKAVLPKEAPKKM